MKAEAQEFGKSLATLMAKAAERGLSLAEIREQMLAGAACASIAMEGAPPKPGPINRVTLAGVIAMSNAARKEVGS